MDLGTQEIASVTSPAQNVVSIGADISVVHVVWQPFGLRAFQRFIESYRSCPAGMRHRLIIVFKGFLDCGELSDYQPLLEGIKHVTMQVPDVGYDIGSYWLAAAEYPSDYHLFLNSRSVILANGWLEMFFRHSCRGVVGVVSATSSCESLYSDHVNLHHLNQSEGSPLRRLVRSSAANRLRHYWYYPPFPNFHVRTNAFMLRKDVLSRIRIWKMSNRLATSRFENGRRSLTRQIETMGLQAITVGRNGVGYTRETCPQANIYWQEEQPNLLVADNQTERYRLANPHQRAALSSLAWGR